MFSPNDGIQRKSKALLTKEYFNQPLPEVEAKIANEAKKRDMAATMHTLAVSYLDQICQNNRNFGISYGKKSTNQVEEKIKSLPRKKTVHCQKFQTQTY